MAVHVSQLEVDSQVNGEDTHFLSRASDSQLEQGLLESTAGPDSGLPENIRRRLVFTLVAILLAFEVGAQMIPGPMVRIIESIACTSYWRAHNPSEVPTLHHLPEQLCKIEEVQAEVATVKGYSDFLEGLLCALCAIPYGLLADRHGRRRALRLTIPGFLINSVITNSVLWFSDSLPLRAIWLAAFSWIIGGGPTVALVVIWTMLADLSQSANRAILFFRVGVISHIANFLASTISSGLMTLNPWIPLMIGCGTVVIGLICALSLPETIDSCVKTTCPMDSDQLSSNMNDSTLGTEAVYSATESFPKSTRFGLISGNLRRIFHPYIFIVNHRLLLLLFAIATFQIAQGSLSFLAQYISTHFEWTLARANLLTSIHAATSIPLFILILPQLSTRILRFLPLPRRDLYISRLSVICLTVGSLGIGVSPQKR
ncbi:hypothetical protein ETB97_007531 [Aspergillus alliaceus]|uniref:MFS transporter n=1 Tax=Petromyces alliaceus TaxID=209559 RepID=A0A8H6E2P0_PETAA|nr:hypothetical protein ETB97_007531 [Aspergillus burnettii]